ncbi:MAG: hypothetical protein JW967_06560 [Dehalococcoidales bacterium]|nr:hypothetical protein [Dehalococcoidales bacterium]
MKERIGEIIEAGTSEYTAQCYELYRIPPLGSLVKTKSGGTEIIGVVCNAATTGLEPGRKPLARGKDETSEEGIYQSSPQLLKLLKSEFGVLVAGFRQADKTYQYLPPQPARIHSFVYPCEPEEVKEFSRSLAFLNILLNTRLPVAIEELAAASLRQMSLVNDDPHSFLVSAGKELAGLLGNEYNRLRTILGRLQG